MVRQITPEKALERLEGLCVKAEYSTGELRRKLYSWRILGEEADRIIESLESRRFVDNERFAKVFVRDKYRFNRWGRLKIRRELRVKGVSDDTSTRAIDEIDDEIYFSVLQDFINSKYRTIKRGESSEIRLKLFKSAAARGYEPDLIAGILRNMKFEEKSSEI